MEDVEVYFQGDTIPEHQRVAVLSGKGNDAFTSRGQLLDKLRTEAGKLGANAIIVGENEEASGGAQVASALAGGIGADRRREAIAIYIER